MNLTQHFTQAAKHKIINVIARLDNGSHSSSALQGADEDLFAIFIEAIELQKEESGKAFGGCTKCYGKGYATQMVNEIGAEDFGGERYETGPHTRINYCLCDRGKQLKALVYEATKYGK